VYQSAKEVISSLGGDSEGLRQVPRSAWGVPQGLARRLPAWREIPSLRTWLRLVFIDYIGV